MRIGTCTRVYDYLLEQKVFKIRFRDGVKTTLTELELFNAIKQNKMHIMNIRYNNGEISYDTELKATHAQVVNGTRYVFINVTVILGNLGINIENIKSLHIGRYDDFSNLDIQWDRYNYMSVGSIKDSDDDDIHLYIKSSEGTVFCISYYSFYVNNEAENWQDRNSAKYIRELYMHGVRLTDSEPKYFDYDEDTMTFKEVMELRIGNHSLLAKDLFRQFRGVEELKLDDVDGSDILSMEEFCESSNLVHADFSGLKNLDIDSLQSICHYCTDMKSVKLPDLSEHAIRNIYGAFAHCRSLESIDLTSINLDYTDNAGWMLSGCDSLRVVKTHGHLNRKFMHDVDTDYMFCGSNFLVMYTDSSYSKDWNKHAWTGGMSTNVKYDTLVTTKGTKKIKVKTKHAVICHDRPIVIHEVKDIETAKAKAKLMYNDLIDCGYIFAIPSKGTQWQYEVYVQRIHE